MLLKWFKQTAYKPIPIPPLTKQEKDVAGLVYCLLTGKSMPTDLKNSLLAIKELTDPALDELVAMWQANPSETEELGLIFLTTLEHNIKEKRAKNKDFDIFDKIDW